MIKKITEMTKEEIDEASHAIADAFFDYEYSDGEIGMKGYLDTREKMFQFMRGIFAAAVHSHCAYQTENGEGYLIMTDTEGQHISLWDSLCEINEERKALGGFMRMLEYAGMTSKDGGSLNMIMAERDARHVEVEILAVRKEFQRRGFMHEMMNFVYEHAQQYGIMVALECDDANKAAAYEHCGMILYRKRHCGEGYHIYDLIR